MASASGMRMSREWGGTGLNQVAMAFVSAEALGRYPYKEAGGVNSAGLFTSWCCVGYAVRTSRIGRCDSWSTSSATLPNMTRLMPRRECVAITIASASASFAVATITFAA